MSQLQASLFHAGSVVVERSLDIDDEVWLGNAPGAPIRFSGPLVRIRRLGERLRVEVRCVGAAPEVTWLDVGATLRVPLPSADMSPQELVLEPTGAVPQRQGRLPDVRLFVATAALILAGAWWDAVSAFAGAHSTEIAAVQAVLTPGAAPAGPAVAAGTPPHVEAAPVPSDRPAPPAPAGPEVVGVVRVE